MRGKELEIAIKSYMDTALIEGNSRDSLENKKGAFKRLSEFLGQKEFSVETIKNYTLFLMEKGLQASSIATDLRKYKAFVNWLYKGKSISENWSNLITLPRIPNKEINVPSAEVAEQIIIAGTTTDKHNVHKTINNEGRDCMLLMVRTGLRVNEALYLEPSDLYLENEGHEWFKVKSKGKSGDKDRLPLMASAVEILKRKRNVRKDYYKKQFFGVSEVAMNTMLARGCKKLNIPKITNHKLRHIFATELAKAGMPSYHLQKLMRHSEIETTLRYYVHMELEDWRKSLEIYHPLALRERTVDQVFKQLKCAIDQLKINTTQFKITTVENQSLLVQKLPD